MRYFSIPWRFTLFSLLLVLTSSSFATESVSITALEWASPRSGYALATDTKLAPLVQQMLDIDGSLQVRYPGGDMGRIWAGELQAWLIALGIPSERIELIPGSRSADTIDIFLAN